MTATTDKTGNHAGGDERGSSRELSLTCPLHGEMCRRLDRAEEYEDKMTKAMDDVKEELSGVREEMRVNNATINSKFDGLVKEIASLKWIFAGTSLVIVLYIIKLWIFGG